MPAAAPAEDKPRAGPQRAMAKLGLVRDIDLALHLPLRYEDETRLVAIADTRDGDVAQVEGRVTDSRVEQRARFAIGDRWGFTFSDTDDGRRWIESITKR